MVTAGFADVAFTVLGPLRAEANGSPVAIGPPQHRALFALLLTRPGRVFAGAALQRLLWPGEPPPAARAVIHSHVSQLRASFSAAGASGLIVSRDSGYALIVAPGSLDLDRFRACVAAALSTPAPEERSRLLRQALAEWSGEAFEGIGLPAVRDVAAELEDERLHALHHRIDADLDAGRHAQLVPELRGLVRIYPQSEALHGHLMIALYRSGRQPDALAVYASIQRHLRDAHGLDPGPELSALQQRLLRHEVSATPRQSAPVDWPLQTLPATTAAFAGRSEERATLRDLLRPGTDPHPILICGPAGAGKSALAIRAAHDVAADHPDGQLFVSLRDGPNPVHPAAALTTLLGVLGYRGAAVPVDLPARSALLRSVLAGRRMLLLLDDAIDEEQLRPLLPGSPSTVALITSRRKLAGMEIRRVSLGAMPHQDALSLLEMVIGAERTGAEERAANALINYTGGIALAVRIIAASLAAKPGLPLAALARQLANEQQRLDALHAGDLSMRAALELSYQQLGFTAQQLLQRLATLGDASYPQWGASALVPDTPNAEIDLETLVDMHLVDASYEAACGTRYRVHPLVRLFAAERAIDAESAPQPTAAHDRFRRGRNTAARGTGRRGRR